MKAAVICCVILALAGSSFAQIEEEELIRFLKQNGANMFADLLVKTGLTDTLKKFDKFTMFIPTDEAFNLNLPLLKEMQNDLEFARKVIRYHLLPRLVMKEDFKDDILLDTLQTPWLRVNMYPCKSLFTVNGAPITKFDLKVRTGVAHLIGKVLYPLPIKDMDFVEILRMRMTDRFSIFLEVLDKVFEKNWLKFSGITTVFAPTNDAFLSIPNWNEILKDKVALRKIVEKLFLEDTLFKAGICPGNMKTFGGEDITIRMQDENTYKINDANIIETDYLAINGVLHVVDKLF